MPQTVKNRFALVRGLVEVTPGFETNWFPHVAFFNLTSGEREIELDSPNTAALYKALKYTRDNIEASLETGLGTLDVGTQKIQMSQMDRSLYLIPNGKHWKDRNAAVAVLEISQVKQLIEMIETL